MISNFTRLICSRIHPDFLAELKRNKPLLKKVILLEHWNRCLMTPSESSLSSPWSPLYVPLGVLSMFRLKSSLNPHSESSPYSPWSPLHISLEVLSTRPLSPSYISLGVLSIVPWESSLYSPWSSLYIPLGGLFIFPLEAYQYYPWSSLYIPLGFLYVYVFFIQDISYARHSIGKTFHWQDIP